jgi:hypothetical protein
MAKLSELIPALANTLGMPETAIEAYAKALRKAGLITTGGRGFGAADMNSRDCARLLTAIMAGSPTYAVERVQTYGNLTCTIEHGEAGRPVYEAFCLTPGHSFVDMLSHIIELAKKDPVDKFCAAALSKANLIPKYKENDLIFTLKIEVGFPEPNASIEVNGFFGDLSKTGSIWISYRPQEYWDKKGKSSPDDPFYGDIKYKTSISQKSVDALGNLLNT